MVSAALIAMLFAILLTSAFWLIVVLLAGKKSGGGERGGPSNPVCVLHVHKHDQQQIWHRGQLFHQHDHDVNHLYPDAEPVDEDERWEPTQADQEACCNATDGQLMRLADEEEACASAKIPQPSANGKLSSLPQQLEDEIRRNLTHEERMAMIGRLASPLAKNVDPSAFPSEAQTRAAEKLDLTARGQRECCLAEA